MQNAFSGCFTKNSENAFYIVRTYGFLPPKIVLHAYNVLFV